MAGVYCARCQSTVLLEQDGRSCSNCAGILVGPPVAPATAPRPAPAKKRPTRRAAPAKS